MRHAPHHVIRQVAIAHGVSVEDIKGHSRKRRISDARKMTFALLYEVTDLDGSERAEFLRKGRATGIYAVNTHYDLLESNHDYAAKYQAVIQRLRMREKSPLQLYDGKIILRPCVGV